MLIPTRSPFRLAQAIAFLRRFPPCAGDYLLTDDSITAALCVGDEPVLFTLRERGGELHVDTTSAMARAGSRRMMARYFMWDELRTHR